jgi:MFS family permease
VVLAFFVRRRFVDDAVVFQAVRPVDVTMNFFAIPRTMLAGFMNFFTNFLANVPAILTWAMTFVLSIGAMAGYYAITLRLPSFLKSQGHALTDGYFFIFIAGAFVGYLAGAWASDRFGRHFAFTTSALGSIVFTVGLCVLPLNDAWVLALTFWLGFFASAVFSGMGAFFTELYPTPTRGARQGSSYSFGRKFAYNLLLVQQFDVHLPSPLLVFIVTAYALVILAALWLPETRGRDLTATGEE